MNVFHCPYRHGYEIGTGPIGVLATGTVSLHQAMLLPDWGPTTLFTNRGLEPTPEDRGRLASRGIQVDEGEVSEIVGSADGRLASMASLFVVPATLPSSPLAEQLGCALAEGPAAWYVATDTMRKTSVPGVFACGDLIRPAGSISQGGR